MLKIKIQTIPDPDTVISVKTPEQRIAEIKSTISNCIAPKEPVLVPVYEMWDQEDSLKS